MPSEFIQRVFNVMRTCRHHRFQVLTKRSVRLKHLARDLPWPDNVWMGVTVEDTRNVSRVVDLVATPAKVKFFSVEPLLEEIPRLPLDGIDWVIVGGESGPGARSMKEEWVVGIKENCLRSNVPFFFKQWGGFHKKKAGKTLQGRTWQQMPRQYQHMGAVALG